MALGREAAPLLDLDALLAAIVVENQLPILRRQRAQAAIETLEEPLTSRGLVRRAGTIGRAVERVCARHLVLLGPAQIFQEDELRDDVAVAGGRRIDDLPRFLEAAGDAVQRLVREIVRILAAFVLKVPDQPAARVEIALTAGIDALVQPGEQALERAASRNPIPFQFGRDASRSSEVRC
jgi:hypothetical protein